MKNILLLVSVIAALLSPRTVLGQTPTTFRYEDSAATSVQVAGEFNDWHAAAMERGADGVWTVSLDLPDGTHGYKFLVNGETWILDPANPARKTVEGNENSAISVGGSAAATSAPSASGDWTFSYTDPQAQAVFVAGSFNGWNTESHPMSKNDAGVWTTTVSLPPGQTTYKFIVDGQWKTDPSNPTLVPDGEGGQNSAVSPGSGASAVSSGDGSAVAPAPSASGDWTFSYNDSQAQAVFVAGSFNGWNTESHPMSKNDAGVWTANVSLPPGQTTYKFIVDGQWKTDPSNSTLVPDGEGGQNSAVTVGGP